MGLRWYLARLKNMEPAEIVHRVSEKSKKLYSKNRHEGWQRYKVERPTIPVIPGLADALSAGADDKARKQISNIANDIMAGHFAALGQEWPPFSFANGSSAVWHRDPVTGAFWPSDIYCFDIGYRHAHDIGDVKYVWEFQRLQFLQAVAAHAFLTNDAAALAFIEQAIVSWYGANPPFRGVGWSSGIELALRAISLLVVSSLVGSSLSIATRTMICTIMSAHVFWLSRFPSRFSSSNNHLVSEDAALLLMSLSCDFLSNKGLEQVSGVCASLAREAGLQIFPDGVPAEQSPTYGALTAELLLLCAFAARGAGIILAPVINERLTAYAEYIYWLADINGFVPAIGDDDEGRVITLARRESRYPASVAAAITSFLGCRDIGVPFDPDLRNILMPGPVTAERPVGTKSFVNGGYTLHRREFTDHSITLLVDHGPLGYLSIAAHGHADALAITLNVDDQPIIVDPGTYLYHSGKEWRDWFRGTRSHNTLTVGGEDQSRIAGAFNWSQKANVTLEELSTKPFRLTASHDGYVTRFNCVHKRSIEWDNNSLRVSDYLLPIGLDEVSSTAELVFQLADDCMTEISGSSVKVICGDKLALYINLPDANFTVSSGGNIDGGWISPQFGKKVAAPRISWKGCVGPNGVVTTIELEPPFGFKAR